MTDLVVWVLDRIAANWNTANFDPQPVLYNEDDGQVRGEAFERKPDLTQANIVTANSAPTTRRTPIGSGFDYRVEPGVSVRIEAVHTDHARRSDGGVADHERFGTLVGEVKRTLDAERKFPIPEDGFHSLVLENGDDRSPNRPDGYYELGFDARFRGYEELP